MLEALGLIEVVGLVGAIEAADTASKAADVKVIGYELTRGSGMVVVKMVGGVSAVKSAVEAASVAAEKITQIISKHVIARPSDELDKIINAEKEKSDKKVEEVIVNEVQKEIVDNNQNDEVNEILEEIKEIQVVKGNKKHKNKK
ncbi:BMC domain-containing protein [Fusobacterium animalis]|uniref:BMC domain-containing protein n=1 Tax=Fusobacterium animalis TaxID=76859 RepID=UPI003247CCC7